MTLFLASNIGGIKTEEGKKKPTNFIEINNFLSNLKKEIKNYRKFVLISSDPTAYEKNDLYLKMDIEALRLSGLKFNEYIVLDDRNKNNIENVLKNSDLIFLCGGNTYIQNNFFNEINLKEFLKNAESVIVGISAGSINAAIDVFNSPEVEEDLVYKTQLKGLELTRINIEPHFIANNENNFKLKSILNESFKREIYGLTESAYILQNNKICRIYGKAYLIKDGNITQVCDDNESINIKG